MLNKTTPVTNFLLLMNLTIHLLVHFFVYAAGPGPYQNFFFDYGLVPIEFWQGSWWQPVTALFIHAGPIHLAVNMLALWSLGTPIEMTLGSRSFAWLYTISGFTGSLFVIFGQYDLANPTVGASGALLGLLGALAIFFPSSRLLVFFIPMSARTAAVVFGVGSILLAFYDSSTNISHIGHLGGLVGGLLYSRFVLGLEAGRQTLHPGGFRRPGFQPRRRGPDPFTGPVVPPSPGPSPFQPGTDESGDDEIFQILNRLRDNNRPGSLSDRLFRKEKEINPGKPEDVSNQGKGEAEAGEGNQQEDGEAQKLHYDPATGKFYLK